jgi:hypothetical protein
MAIISKLGESRRIFEAKLRFAAQSLDPEVSLGERVSEFLTF